jgi:hypothetical protein
VSRGVLPLQAPTTAADSRCSRRRSAGGDGGITLSVPSDPTKTAAIQRTSQRAAASNQKQRDYASSNLSAVQSSVVLPPAAAIFSFADAEKACAVTCSATEMSPPPRILTGAPGRTAPAATRSATPTVPPSGNS